MSRLYAVRVGGKIGDLLTERDSITDARKWAKRAFGVRRGDVVALSRKIKRCERCDSAPCCCNPRGNSAATAPEKDHPFCSNAGAPSRVSTNYGGENAGPERDNKPTPGPAISRKRGG